MRVLTIWKTYSRPTASELSDGLRASQRPCGPWSPTPRPSKLVTSVAGARLPCSVCSTVAPGDTVAGRIWVHATIATAHRAANRAARAISAGAEERVVIAFEFRAESRFR